MFSVRLDGSLRHESNAVFYGSEMLAIYLTPVIPIALLTPNVFTGRLSRFISLAVGLGGFSLLLTTGSRIALLALLAFMMLVFYCVVSINSSGGAVEARWSIVHGCFWGVIALAVVSLAESTFGNQIAYLNWTILLLVGSRNLWAPTAAALEKKGANLPVEIGFSGGLIQGQT